MELTAWQKICHRVLGRVIKNKARDDEELAGNLIKGNIPIMAEVYLSQVIVTSLAVLVVCLLIITAFFFPVIGVIDFYETLPDETTAEDCYLWEYWNPDLIDSTKVANGCPYFKYQVFPGWATGLIPGLFGFLIPFGTYKYLKGGAGRAKKTRGATLEKFLPYAASYTAAMAAANSTPTNIFRSLAINEDIYGEIAYDASMIYRDVTLLGYDLITAMKLSVDRAASPWMVEFFQGMVGTLTAGGSLKLYFLNRAEHYMRENRTRLHDFLEGLAMLAESYIVVAVAMPLFLIVMLVIMFWVSGKGAQISTTTMYGVVLVALPVIHSMFIFLVWSSSEENKM
ncbi:MAG TPA: hypothetical protein EYQ73_06670 [Candidatus Poseidoniales archaeon]|nr:hypothetical protein [Candidatus Poseidoniales archaeon]HIL65626.1 hypothetical protein [Candidatus Poseidoniales archaeon]